MEPGAATRARSPDEQQGALAAADFTAALEEAKLEALYQFAYGLSHEINNPLANIATRAQTLLADEPDADRRRKLATIVHQAFRAHEMIADLMLFARPPALRREPTDLVKLADRVLLELQPTAKEQGTKLTRRGRDEALVAAVDAAQLGVALKAIVQNGLEAVKAGGAVEVTVESAECGVRSAGSRPEFKVQGSKFKVDGPHLPAESGNLRSIPHSDLRIPHFVLSVADTGPGIPPETRPHLFDPYFSGREAGRGLGLGLSKAWRIVTLHSGWIEVESEPGSGARFMIFLPLTVR